MFFLANQCIITKNRCIGCKHYVEKIVTSGLHRTCSALGRLPSNPASVMRERGGGAQSAGVAAAADHAAHARGHGFTPS